MNHKSMLLIVAGVWIFAGCAGTHGRPEQVKISLEERYLGKPLLAAVKDLGTPVSEFQVDESLMAYTWKRQTDKYKSNLLIKSDERCVITMFADTKSRVIKEIGQVDDSLGAYKVSYCAEQYGL